MSPSATLSPSTDFPFLVIRPTLLQGFLPGTRRASPVAQHPLASVPPLPPRRSAVASPTSLRQPMLPSPFLRGLGLRNHVFSRPPLRSLALRPGDSLTNPKLALSMGFRPSVSLQSAIQATGPLALTLAGLTPAEDASLHWTHIEINTYLPISPPIPSI